MCFSEQTRLVAEKEKITREISAASTRREELDTHIGGLQTQRSDLQAAIVQQRTKISAVKERQCCTLEELSIKLTGLSDEYMDCKGMLRSEQERNGKCSSYLY